MNAPARLAAVSAVLAALSGAALAADAPHDATQLIQPFCSDCHLLHGAAGPSLTAAATNANLCLTCHAGRTNPTVTGWAAGDQATATTGSSHSWTGAAVAPDKGAALPASATLLSKLAGGTNLQCSTCHDQHSQGNAPFDLTAPASGGGRHFLQVANAAGQLCADCHAPWAQASAAAGTYVTGGTASFTLNGTAVTGTGTTWLATVQPGWRIKALSHGASAWAYVRTVNSNTSITLAAPYTGATVSGTAYVASRTLSHPVGDPMVASSLAYGTPLDTTGAPQVPALFGSATGGSTTTLQDTTKNFTGMVGRVVRFTSGPNRGQIRTITSIPSSSQLGWAGALTAVTAGTTYEVDLDGNFSNNLALVNGGAASFTTGAVACQTCHGVHFADSSATTYDDRPPTPVGTGDGKLLRRTTAQTCDACHPGWLMHSSATLGTKYGTWGTTFTCATCHQPHKTGNVFLVRDTIATPNSGSRDVDLRALGGGVEAYGLANSVTPGTGPCETCHTQTRNGSPVTGATSTFNAASTAVTLSSTTGLAAGWEVKRTADGVGAWTRIASVNTATTLTLSQNYRGISGSGTWEATNPRFRNTGSGRGATGTEHYVTACLGCHPHKDGFKGAGESNGAAACDGCHSDLTARMAAASGGNTLGGRPILSRHQVTGFGSADSNTTWAAPLNGVAAANRSCLNMCHGDHPHDLTSPVVATHEYNTYLDATSQATRNAATRTSATRTRTDFDAAQASGGLCVSCHRFAGDAASPVQHPAIDKAAYDASAHDFTSNTVGASTYDWRFTQHDGGVFQRNCTKCHAGNGDGAPNATSLPMEAVHYSANPSLLAGNMSPAAAGNTVGEQVCYGCHGNGTVGVNRSGKNLYDEVTSAFGHPVNSDAVHDTPSEGAATANNGKFSGANRHVNCADCHDPHQAQPVGSGARAGSITGYTVVATDYTTGTASGSRNGTAVTGAGTIWTAAMVGRAISWTSDPDVWYGITAFTSATAITISPALPANRSGAYVIRGAFADTLTDSTQAWTKNQFKGWTLKLVSGAQAGRTSAIYGNGTTTGTQLLVKFPSAPAVGDRYVITPSGSRVASGMPPGSPAMAGAWGVQPNYGTPLATPPTWNDGSGCGAAGTANACEVITGSYSPITSFTKTASNPPPEAYVCLKCHSSFAYGTTLANFPASPSGQPNVPDGTGQAWSNTVGVAMRQSDIASDANPANVGHHALLARGRNQPMVSSASATSVRNPNWPAHTAGTVNVAANGTTVTLNAGTWPVNLVPGWFIYLGNANPANPSAGWYEVTGVTSDTVLTIDRGCASPSTCSATSAYHLTAGLGNTFVPPWGPWSVLECSDCHRSSTLTDPLGPHGSATKWMLRGADTQVFLGGVAAGANSFTQTVTPTDVNNLCLNCHRKDVYGDYTVLATPGTVVAGMVYTFSRQNHPADKDNGSSVDYRTRWGIMCMNCHGGARQGGIHGQNLGIGNGGATAASYSGRRLLAGSSWFAVTRSSTATAGQCWTKGTADAVDSCGHSHSGVAFQSGTANYDYESTQGGGTP